MLRPDEMPSQIEQITDGSVGTQKPLSLTYGLESPHPSLPHPGRLMGLLCSIILILFSAVDHIGDQLSMGDPGRCQPHMDSQFKDNIYFT